MAIQTEVWARDIADNIFPDNSFVIESVDESVWVNNKTVHRSQAGSPPSVSRNRTTLPATAVKRTDTDLDYSIDEYSSTPTVIPDIEEIETSYQKRQSVLRNHINEINLQIANWMGYHWAPTADALMVRTSGDNRPANLPGATGTRKKVTLDDFLAAKLIMDDADIPMEGRCALIPAHMYNDLLSTYWESLVSLDKTGEARIQSGKHLTALFGFKIYIRGKNNVVQYTNAATPVLREPTAANLTTANAAAIFWHKDFVARAKGLVKVYENIDDATYYGSLFSAMSRAGGKPVYTDRRGVVALIEAAGV